MGFWSKSLHSALPQKSSQKTWKALPFLPPCLSLSSLHPFSPCTPSSPSKLSSHLCLAVHLSLPPSLSHLPCFYPSSLFCLPLPLTSYSLHFPPAFSLPFSGSLFCVFSPSFPLPPSLSLYLSLPLSPTPQKRNSPPGPPTPKSLQRIRLPVLGP